MVIVIGLAYTIYFQSLTTDEDGTIEMLRLLRFHKNVLSVLAFVNYFQNQSTEDAGPIRRYYVLRNIKCPEIAVLICGLEKRW